MKLRTKTLRPGFKLFHGTSEDFDEATELEGPCWFSDSPEVAKFFSGWRQSDNTYKSKSRIAQFEVVAPLNLLLIPDGKTLGSIRDEYLMGSVDIEDLIEWVCSNHYDGWIIPKNYPEGADILLCSTNNVRHVETKPNLPVHDSIYRVATRALNEILDAGDDLPPRRSPHAGRFGWKPVQPGQGQQQYEQPKAVKIGHKPTPANRWQQIPPTWEQPMTYLSKEHLDAVMQRIKDEEALPPHQQNAARIAAMKQQALEMMKRLEALEVQRQADQLLPRIDG